MASPPSIVHNQRPLNLSSIPTAENIFPTCRRTLGSLTWGRVLAAMGEDLRAEAVPDALVRLSASMNPPGFLTDLARVEWLLHEKK